MSLNGARPCRDRSPIRLTALGLVVVIGGLVLGAVLGGTLLALVWWQAVAAAGAGAYGCP